MPIFIPPLTYQQIAEAAERCLAQTHPASTIPVPIEDMIDVGYRIDLVPTPNLEARFSTVAYITRDLREIRVDDFVFNRQPYRLRFSIAHELGHLVLHRNIYTQMTFTTPDEWKTAMESLGQAEYKRLESQADRFAGLLLVPPAQFRDQFEQVTIALAQARTTFKNLSEQSQDYAVKALAKTFDVSSGAIWFRLRDERLI
jgi:hypothetical protein